MRYHGAENCNVQRMFIKIVFFAPQILHKINFPVQMTVTLNNVGSNRLYLGVPRGLYDALQLFLYGKNANRLEAFKFDIIFGHWRNRLRRFQHENTEQTEIFNTVQALRRQS